MSKKSTNTTVKMKPHADRIAEAILFIIHEAAKRKQTVTQYDIVKTLFLADRAHLNKFGRPITYDNYVAMEHGPVPSYAYNLLKQEARTPWKRVKGKGKEYLFQKPVRKVDEDILSPSDRATLAEMLTVVKSLGFGQIRRLTHEDQAYDAAWKRRRGKKSAPMDYALLFDKKNSALAAELAFMSQHM